jgi:hypothetical protein
MTPKDIEGFASAVVEVWRRIIDGPRIGGRFDALEARVAELEARPIQKWAGVHAQGTPYAEASLVTRGGSLWVARRSTTTTPGSPESDWTLVVKKGGYDA